MLWARHAVVGMLDASQQLDGTQLIAVQNVHRLQHKMQQPITDYLQLLNAIVSKAASTNQTCTTTSDRV